MLFYHANNREGRESTKRERGKEVKWALTLNCELINVEGVVKLYNPCFATILGKIGSGTNHQGILNPGGNLMSRSISMVSVSLHRWLISCKGKTVTRLRITLI